MLSPHHERTPIDNIDNGMQEELPLSALRKRLPIYKISTRAWIAKDGPQLLILLLFVFGLLAPLLGRNTLYWGDIILYFAPMFRFVSRALHSGHLPLWNPYIHCGQPCIGNPQIGVFYPFSLLLCCMSVWRYISALSFIHLYLGGVWTFYYLRRWALGSYGPAAGAMIWMGSGCLLGRLQFPPMICTAAFLPALLLCLDRCIDQSTLRYRLELALIVGLMLLAAHTQMAYLNLLCGTIYAVARIVSKLPGAGRRLENLHQQLHLFLRFAVPIVAASMLGIAMASLQLLPAIQLMLESAREKITTIQANRFILTYEQLLTLVFPHFMGHPATANYWGRGNAWEPSLFVGWMPIVILVYAFKKNRQVWSGRFWTGFAIFSIWMSLGIYGGLYWLAFFVLPGLSKFHDPARFLVLTTFAIATLTSIGLDHWLLKVNKKVDKKVELQNLCGCIALALIATPLLWYASDWIPTASIASLQYTPHIVKALKSDKVSRQSGSSGRILLPLDEHYWKKYISDGYVDYGANNRYSIDQFLESFMDNTTMDYGVEMASGYEPVPLRGTAFIDSLARNALKRGEPNLNYILNLLNVEQVVVPTYDHLFRTDLCKLDINSSSQYLQPRSPVNIYTNQKWRGRSWLVRNVRHIEGKKRIAAVLAASNFHPDKTAIVSGDDVGLPISLLDQSLYNDSLSESVQLHDKIENSSIQMRLKSPEKIDIDVNTGLKAAFMVYSQSAYPGWRATLDGHDVDLVVADGALIGLYLPPGYHKVRITYHPDSFYVGLYISLIAVVIVCGCVAFLISRHLPSP